MGDGEEDWIWILERYAHGRRLCNCKDAYYSEEGHCAYGCSANQIITKYEMASKIRKELEKLDNLTQ